MDASAAPFPRFSPATIAALALSDESVPAEALADCKKLAVVGAV